MLSILKEDHYFACHQSDAGTRVSQAGSPQTSHHPPKKAYQRRPILGNSTIGEAWYSSRMALTLLNSISSCSCSFRCICCSCSTFIRSVLSEGRSFKRSSKMQTPKMAPIWGPAMKIQNPLYSLKLKVPNTFTINESCIRLKDTCLPEDSRAPSAKVRCYARTQIAGLQMYWNQ